MAYSGRYQVMNTNKYQGDPTKVVYRSLWEKYCFLWCDSNPKIKMWSSEEVVIPYYYDVDKKYHRYFVDLKIVYEDNKTVLVEIKPDKETKVPQGQKRTKRYINESLTYIKNMNKWSAAQEYCKDRKWDFQIWTEDTLIEMGLLPKKMPGKIKKPLKRLPPYRKKKSAK